MAYRIVIKVMQAFACGIGLDVSQRLLDHAIDMATDRFALLEWLK